MINTVAIEYDRVRGDTVRIGHVRITAEDPNWTWAGLTVSGVVRDGYDGPIVAEVQPGFTATGHVLDVYGDIPSTATREMAPGVFVGDLQIAFDGYVLTPVTFRLNLKPDSTPSP